MIKQVTLVLAAYFFFQGVVQAQSGFCRAHEWNGENAEVLEYEAVSVYRDQELKYPLWLVSEAGWYSFTEGKTVRKQHSGYQPVILSSLAFSFQRHDFPRHVMATTKIFRRDTLPLAEERVSILSWEGQIIRQLSTAGPEQRLTVDSWIEGNSSRKIEKGPVYTVEQLFTWLRGLDFQKPFEKNIWLLPSLLEDMTKPEPLIAEVKLHPETMTIQDQKTRYVTVTLEGGKIYEFWLLEKGLHAVFIAKYPDGTYFTLKKTEWKRYRFMNL